MATVEWPPFTGQNLPALGTTTHTVREICTQAGLEPDILFLPWKRVLTYARAGRVQGYFPEYKTPDLEREFIFSAPIGYSVLGIVHPSGLRPAWNRLEDLASYRIGIVDGYANTPRFDELAISGVLRTIKCKDDASALRLLLAGRIELAVMDREVFAHLMRSHFPIHSGTLAFARHTLVTHSLHLCFPKTETGRALAERFDQALEQMALQPQESLPDTKP